jgi:two-component system nitrate/nitrite sensor histidine kinase NarX
VATHGTALPEGSRQRLHAGPEEAARRSRGPAEAGTGPHPGEAPALDGERQALLPRWVACLLRSPARRGSFLDSPVCRPLAALLVTLAGCLVASLIAYARNPEPTWLALGQVALVGTAAGLVVLLYRSIDRQLLAPLSQLRDWALRMRGGDLGARLPVPAAGEFRRVAGDINDLGDSLQRLSQQMDQEVWRHTENLAQKTRSLQVLYDVAASVNLFNDLDDLLTRFLHTLIDVVKAKAAAVRLLDKDGHMRLVASVGLSEQDLAGMALASADPAAPAGPGPREEVSEAFALPDRDAPPTGPRGLHALAVPLRYHGKTLGVYDLFVDLPGLVEREDLRDLLTSIGRHLGMAIEKVRVDSQAQRLSIMQERNLLAHELHDSLAQTLASLRFQVRMLDDTLGLGDLAQARGELDRIRDGLEEANAELRGLLAHFRAPIDRRGLLPALEDLVARFRRETGIVTFFQKECAHTDLPATQEMQVVRIVQEALANIRKHSQAHAVRILLRCDDEGHYHVMVEDDGVGIAEDVAHGGPGEHIGLAILQERARRIGGEVTVESEPAEGTRVELNFTGARAR